MGMHQSAQFVADQINSEIESERVYNNGVDLIVDTIKELSIENLTPGSNGQLPEARIVDSDYVYQSGDDIPGYVVERKENVTNINEWSEIQCPTYYIGPGVYVVQFKETVSIPEGYVGQIFLFEQRTDDFGGFIWDAEEEAQLSGVIELDAQIFVPKHSTNLGRLMIADKEQVLQNFQQVASKSLKSVMTENAVQETN